MGTGALSDVSATFARTCRGPRVRPGANWQARLQYELAPVCATLRPRE